MADEERPLDSGDTTSDLERMREALKRANAEAKRYREQLEQTNKELATLRDASTSETEKLAAQLAELRQRADEADRRALIAEIAQDRGLTKAQAKWLARAAAGAKTAEEIAQIADEFVADLGQTGDTGEADAGSRPSTRPTAGRPREALRPGAIPRGDSGGDQPFDESKFLAAVPRV